MVPIFTHNTLNHFIINYIFRIRIWPSTSAIHASKVMVVAVQIIHSTFVLKQITKYLTKLWFQCEFQYFEISYITEPTVQKLRSRVSDGDKLVSGTAVTYYVITTFIQGFHTSKRFQ